MNRSQIILAGGAIALVIGSTAALSETKAASILGSPTQANAIQATAMPLTPSVIATPQPSGNSLPAPPIPAPLSPFAPNYSSYQAHRISTCEGQPSNANFRAYPSLNASAILGVVKHGQMIYLTGRITYSDGVNWHEAITPSLFSVLDSRAQNYTEPDQVGWVAGCFIKG